MTELGSDLPQFFKYITSDVGRVVMNNRTLRWSTPGTLNDPFDMQFDLRVNFDRASVRSAALQKLRARHYGAEALPAGNRIGDVINALRGAFPRFTEEEFDRKFGPGIDEALSRMELGLPELQREARRLIPNSKILCLSEVADNVIMWTHYAERHRGIVLRFRMADGLDSPWRTARPVQYVAEIPNLLDDEFLADLLSGGVKLRPKLIMDRLIYTKSVEWAYEREWRIYSGSGRNPNAQHEDIRFHPLELDAAILGCRMPVEERNQCSHLIGRLYPHAEVMEAARADNEFRLNVRPL